ncbi:MAG: vWA domain-containing protein [Pseudomonadota bacterium]
MSSIPLADAAALEREARRTLLLRLAIAALAVTAVVAAAAAGRHPDLHRAAFVPPGSSGIVVLDLSASISSDTYERIGNTLAELAGGGGRYGLVVFSDTAYEALPPGTRAEELRPLVRYFTLPRQEQPGFLPEFPRNPWQDTFSSGTRISTGLELAREIIRRERLRRPAILLVSDLDDDPIDVPRLRRTLAELETAGTKVSVVALNPSPEDERFFRRLLREPGELRFARLPMQRASTAEGASFPWPLVAASLAAAGALGVAVLWGARLTWRQA